MQPPWIAASASASLPFISVLVILSPLLVDNTLDGEHHIGTDQGTAETGNAVLHSLDGYWVITFEIDPGIIDGEPARDLIGLSSDTDDVVDSVSGKGAADIAEVLLRMVPPNIVTAAANGQMLGLIFFSLIFGFFVSKLQGSAAQVHKDFWQGLLDIMMMMTHFIMKFAPIGVYALVTKVIMISGVDAFEPLALFFLTVILALAVHLLLFLPAVLRYLARVSPSKHFKAMLPALLTAFSTSSSSATLPITMDCVENRAGVSNQVSGFTLPLGATINMDGTALYEAAAAIFIAQAIGVEMTLMHQLTIALTATLAAIGVGLWLDGHSPAHFSWTLTLIFIGVLVGCLNAWYWIRQEIDRD